ncbi:YicC/YloC family endoribonuclease [Alcanivorax sp. 1008]|uniref:YicC/YloC family endoribonuclease n=1 Tax=Alcanivorax sp. 1008 TaxID=2816853 RepID=UPI001D70458E|nr:YicC/YloC family endoribonuclease [Alcanivorax sp. 1008]MCC1497453.1 YicC family protein [Alcanivorax sp. 1008]
MIYSMTAFARVEKQLDDVTLIWELKSVNHRYLEVSPRLPEAFRDIEGPLREQCRKALGRGKLEVGLRYQLKGGEGELTLNEALVQQLASAARKVGDIMRHPAPVDITSILRFPGVMQGMETDLSGHSKTALTLLDDGLRALAEARAREGETLASLINERLAAVVVQVERVRTALPAILDNLRDKLKKRVEEVIASPDAQRLEQEIVILAQKMDVAEELDRLLSHVGEVRRSLQDGGQIGRRLDFLMQELNREANTLGSKSVDTETTQAAIELKVLIEQMREQVQNIE